jgi:hypothetical protein
MVRVNGEVVDPVLLREERTYLRQRLASEYESIDDPRTAREWLDSLAQRNVVARILLQQEAWKNGESIPEEEILRAFRERRGNDQSSVCGPGERHETEARLRLERLLNRITQDIRRPNRKEIDLYYKTHRSQFVAPERIHVSHIVKNVDETVNREAVREGIGKAAEELEKGVPFAEVADRISDCAGNGGDLGWFARGAMVDEFDEVVFGMQQGAVSPVFETRFGFHIAWLKDRKPEGIRPLSEVRDGLATSLWEERKQTSIAKFVDALIGRAEITV